MKKEADVCLIVEGAYPFVTGGVASWCHRLISWFEDEFTFHLVTLTAGPKTKKDFKYKLPPNVISFSAYDICDYSFLRRAKPKGKIGARELEALERLMTGGFRDGSGSDITPFIRLLEGGESLLKKFLVSEEGFSLLTRIYARKRPVVGFTKYFYNWRNIHLVMWRVFLLLREIPPARVYHAPSTGFAGFLACMAALLRGGVSAITEHGIYVQEREIEMKEALWLDEPYLREMWIDFFKALTRWQYLTVDRLITLYHDNARLQWAYGAPPEKTKIVPNGIQIERFVSARRRRVTSYPPVVGLVARIEPIKDIKTFIQTVAVLKEEFPDIKAYVVGPLDDESYYEECLDLVKLLELENTILFTGPADVVEYYRKFDLLFLTSIKEAMPLVLLEAMASGLPVVATRVGACPELLYGTNDNLGPAGLVATPANPQDIAEKALRILKDPDLAFQMGKSGIKRVEKFFHEEKVKKFYHNLYSGV